MAVATCFDTENAGGQIRLMATDQQAVVSEDEKQKYAYQYVGYPALSQWMSSSNDFFLVRKFGAVTARSILYLQHQIAKRELMLEHLDEKSLNWPPGCGARHSIEIDDAGGPRGQVMAELLPLLERYRKYKLCLQLQPLLLTRYR